MKRSLFLAAAALAATVSLAGAHHFLLELLIELVHAAEHRAGAAVADALAAELDDCQHFL